MIKLIKSECPTTLQVKGVKGCESLCGRVAKGDTLCSNDFKKEVYGADDVRCQLDKDQHNKCAYCECNPGVCGNNEVEHYRPKTCYRGSLEEKRTESHYPGYYWLAYEWDNLLMCCRKCNELKSDYFPLMDETKRNIDGRDISGEVPLLINPYYDDPADYIEYNEHMMRAKKDSSGQISQRGDMTIRMLKLNERLDLLNQRRLVWEVYVFLKDRYNDEVKDGEMDRAELFRKKIEEMENDSQEFSGMIRYQCHSI